jgi:anti-sigma factor RsiW
MNTHIRGTDLSALVDGELAPSLRDESLAHIERCSRCKTELERLERTKIRLAAMTKHIAPAALLSSLRRKHSAPTPWRAWFTWKPLAVMGAVAIVAGVWFSGRRSAASDYIDMDSLLAAHARYQEEALVPHVVMANARFSARLASFYDDEN